MSEVTVRVHPPDSVRTAERRDGLVARLASLLPGIQPEGGGAPSGVASVRGPSYAVVANEEDWRSLLGDVAPQARVKRRCLMEQIRSLLSLHASTAQTGRSLADETRREAERHRQTVERAWVSLLEQGRRQEEAVRYCALFFSNLQDSVGAFKGKLVFMDASAEEIASDNGRARLARMLSEHADRPDPRLSRAFVVVQGWVGNPTALDRLGRAVHKERAVLVSDAPSYGSLDELATAAMEGGLLESLAGEQVHHRHMVLVANRGRVRRAFQGRFAQESQSVHVPMSGPWFGGYLDNIARGLPWRPAIGYRNPIGGVDGVMLDLRLTDHDGYGLYLRHRLNPCILLSSGSRQVVIWGPDALSKSGRGVQIGVGVVEMLLARYAEWVVNKYGLLEDLEKAEETVRNKLAEFVVMNSGAGRMFRSGSRVRVEAVHTQRRLDIEFEILFREVAEKARVQIAKPLDRAKRGQVDVRVD